MKTLAKGGKVGREEKAGGQEITRGTSVPLGDLAYHASGQDTVQGNLRL